jgi:hypothetical protein
VRQTWKYQTSIPRGPWGDERFNNKQNNEIGYYIEKGVKKLVNIGAF